MVVGRGLTTSAPLSSSYRRPSSGIRSSSATVNGRPAAGQASAIVTTLMVPPPVHDVHTGWVGALSGKLPARSWHDRSAGGQWGSQTWFYFRMIMAARALGLGTLGGV